MAVRSAGMAKMLLGHVVDGPELDLIWSGFNPDDGDTTVDDEEHEARLLHPAELEGLDD